MEANIQQLILKPFDRISDYAVYAQWWEDGGHTPPSIKDLPLNGFCVKKGDKLIACAFVALTDCDFGVFAFWFANPESGPIDVYRALSYTIEAAKRVVIYNGRNQIFAYTSLRGMVNLLKRHEFINNDGHLRWSYG